jgi:DNA polymerase I-like protein with 3'-5' exonuclease and polymerase domains
MKGVRPLVTIDFETKKIEGRPRYPPIPVGVSLWETAKEPRYLAWGHPTGNNCTHARAKQILGQIWTSNKVDMLFQNAKFDVEVATAHMGLPMPDWRRIHDTQYLLFLKDPHARSLSLKPSAERYLGMPPEEQLEVFEWLRDHGIIKSVTQKDAGAYISEAPGDIVGRYANGDTVRTKKLFDLLYPEIVENEMVEAYDRERALMPILLRNEQEGIRVDTALLSHDYDMYSDSMEKVDKWLRKRLAAPSLNIQSDQDLADALEAAGVVTEWNYTEPSSRHPNGVRSVAKNNVTADMFSDQRVFNALNYRNRLATCIGTFMERWIDLAKENGGFIHTNWNQVRHTESGGAGARTGRMSTNPNFQNIPKSFEDKGDGYAHPSHIKVPPLPLMRRYVLPDEGEVFAHRDYNQQELRILAHFDNSTLMQSYIDNPRMDVHTYVQEQIFEIAGIKLERSPTKVLNFGVVYGMGLGKLAAGMKTDVTTAKRVKDAQMKALPGLKALTREINSIGKTGLAIRTWGGRMYYSEEPKMIGGRMQTFEYKLLNYLIQGSAGDCTKEAIIRYDKMKEHGRFLVTVHDEINISVPPQHVKREMEILRGCMQSVEFDVAMLSDGKTGPSWGSLTKYEEK